MSEITTLNTSTNWTASTETSWIHINPSTGTAGESININVDPATLPSDEEVGSVTIKTETDTITKEIKRCKPSVANREGRVEYRLLYNGSEVTSETKISPCENGINGGSSSTEGIKIDNIFLRYKVTLSNGTTYFDPAVDAPDNEQIRLQPSEVKVWFEYPNNQKSEGRLNKNDGVDRVVTVFVEYTGDTSINCRTADGQCKSFTQLGLLKNSQGEYDYTNTDKFVETGYTSEVQSYEDFDFATGCKDKTSANITSPTYCEGGSFTFTANCKTFTSYGVKTGKTICGETKEVERSSSGTKTNVQDSCIEIMFDNGETSLDPDTYFDGKTLKYPANKSRTTDRTLNIMAKISEDSTCGGGNLPSPITTTFTIVKSGGEHDCSDTIYIHAYADDDDGKISSEEQSVLIKYYLSTSEEDDERQAITDTELLGSLSLQCPGGIKSCGSPTVENGVKKQNVVFYKRTQMEGTNWVFSASSNVAINTPKKVSIYQAGLGETIIPNCDYFVFSYEWNFTPSKPETDPEYCYTDGTGDGVDLDTLTVISGPEWLKAWNNRERQITPTSEISIGYGGINGTGDIYNGNYIFAEHSGDNRCSGAEGAIICISNIINYGKSLGDDGIKPDDVINIDIYADWYRVKGDTYSASIKYSQYSGTSAGITSDIIREPHTCIQKCRNTTYENTYNVFKPNIEGGVIPIAEGVTTPRIPVGAYGSGNHDLAYTCIESVDRIYTHTARLTYKINGGNPVTLFTPLRIEDKFVDNGIDESRSGTYNYQYTIDRNYSTGVLEHTDGSNTILIKQEGGRVKIADFYITESVNGSNYNVYPFDCDIDYVVFYEYEPSYENEERRTVRGKKYTIAKSDLGNTYDGYYIKNFTITKNASKKIDIEFEYDANNDSETGGEWTTGKNRDFQLELYFKTNLVSGCDAIKHYSYFRIKQNITT